MLRHVRLYIVTMLAYTAGAGCAAFDSKPPIAQVKVHTSKIHGYTRVDDYYWLRERDNASVIDYLKAENAYTDSKMKHTRGIQEKLFVEMKGRIKENDMDVPVRDGNHFYYSRTEEGKQYPIYCRKGGSLEGDEEIILDVNQLAAGHKYFRVGVRRVSPNHKLFAYSTDTTGNETYTLYIKNLETGKLLTDEIPNTYYSVQWGNDNSTLFYSTLDDAKRPYKLFRHRLGTPAEQDQLVYHEKDERYFLRLSKTRSDRYLLLSLGSNVTSEVRYLAADDPEGHFQIIHPRQQGMEYSVAHHGDHFYIVTNDQAVNFKLVKTPVSSPSMGNWVEVIAHRPDVKLDGVGAFAHHIAIYERDNGLTTLRIMNPETERSLAVTFPEPVYTYRAMGNAEFNTDTIRFGYTSLTTPRSVFDYNMNTRSRVLMKQNEVLGGYDPNQYTSERIFATAKDGTRIPISIVYGKDVDRSEAHPMLLTGYGSYGSSYDPRFSSTRLSLLERGMIYAIAHIRGGGDMGRPWYENGKLLNKRNTFTDFIACAEHLVQEGYTDPDNLVITGGSAGGLLMGAVTNMRPDLFRAVVARVPFVDVMNTMLDPSIPLTVIEYEEWGNPHDKQYYDYMMTYSPYDNVTARDYPNLLITAGLNDPRVQYWEPAKWTAKLRAMKTDDNLLILKTNMGAGHGGASGRYDRLKQTAFQYAFMLDMVGIKK